MVVLPLESPVVSVVVMVVWLGSDVDVTVVRLSVAGGPDNVEVYVVTS